MSLLWRSGCVVGDQTLGAASEFQLSSLDGANHPPQLIGKAWRVLPLPGTWIFDDMRRAHLVDHMAIVRLLIIVCVNVLFFFNRSGV